MSVQAKLTYKIEENRIVATLLPPGTTLSSAHHLTWERAMTRLIADSKEAIRKKEEELHAAKEAYAELLTWEPGTVYFYKEAT